MIGIADDWNKIRIDVACASAVWEEENKQYQEAKENAGKEAGMRSDELERYKQQLENNASVK